MVKKSTQHYTCINCGAVYSRWTGKCNTCGEWNTISEQLEVTSATAASSGKTLQTARIDEVLATPSMRISTGMSEVDQVLGGGIVPGSVILLAGQPGIGKSTLLMQLAALCSRQHKVIYVSGEESLHQVGSRGKRLGVPLDKMMLAASNSANDIAATISQKAYDVAIVDSIQTVSCQEISSQAGSVSQITNSTQLLTVAAKQTNTALIIVGHVTKEGSIAGPKLLEHVVDVVLQIEGDRYGGFKLLRSIKNRFGSTNETGIFEMSDQGMMPVTNPSAALLAERQITDGSVVLATMEGSRPLLVEVQALVNKTVYGYPKRAASGIDLNRVNLLVAMLERRTKLAVSDYDIYINIVGGLRITEPAADLAVCMAIASAAKGMQLKQNAVVFGEVGLSGEVRHVPQIDKRIAEAQKLGFKTVIGPAATPKKSTAYEGVRDVRQALNTYLEV